MENMHSINSGTFTGITFLFPISLLISVGLINVGAILNPTYLYHNCTTTSTSIPDSFDQFNLYTVLSCLSSSAEAFREFHNASEGGVYGLFLCRGDVNATACRDCVTFATRDVVKRCPVEEQAMLWYDECQLRYSSRSFFGTVDERPRVSLLNTANVTQRDQDRFSRLLNATMKETAAEAARGGPGEKKFATKEADFNGFQKLYNLAQCTPDLAGEDCGRCLADAIGRLPICCAGKLGGRVLFPSCNVRYEFYPFQGQTASPPAPPPGSSAGEKGNSNKISSKTIVAIVVPIAVCLILFILGFCFLSKRAKRKNNAAVNKNDTGNDISTIESLQFDLVTIEAATNKFSADNKLGEGGFGEVYMGTLPTGQQIAVKRLSKSSGQGAQEFKNEVVVLAKLQHRNLVRLLGFCLEGEEKLLVYEFAPNKSLDYFLYDPEKQGQLNWPIRCNIIEGIARGVLYLHEDSRLKIIHRDLKASNILLDKEMNPKVSDFGMAKMFGVDQTQGNTKRIVGTYGYMAPEYAMEGLYSIKSDVFSFGVLLLEILSGRRNTSFHITDSALSLVAYAWQLWNAGKALDLVDSCLKDSCHDPNKFLRYIQVGLLCVQEHAILRPTMSSVVLMLKSEALSLSQPERPAFIADRHTSHQEIIALSSFSVNEMTVSNFLPR